MLPRDNPYSKNLVMMNKGGVQHIGQYSKKPENIVLVGRTGNGKSATGNSLIGRKVFQSKAQSSGVTMECQTGLARTADGHTFNVIDTPGLYDLSAKFLGEEIVRCLTLAEGGIHAVLLVLSARTRMTQEEQNTLSSMQGLFGSRILDFVIVVFTGGDGLEEDKETLENYLGRDCPDFIKDVVRMCGNRMVLFDNKTRDAGKKAAQVNKLFSLIDEIRRSNRGEAYTCDMYQKIKEETDILRKKQEELESTNHSKESISRIEDEIQTEYQKKMDKMSEEMMKKLKDTFEAEKEKVLKMSNNLVPGTVGEHPSVTLSLTGYTCSIL